jgi:hypothetical protein
MGAKHQELCPQTFSLAKYHLDRRSAEHHRLGFDPFVCQCLPQAFKILPCPIQPAARQIALTITELAELWGRHNRHDVEQTHG